MQRICALFLCLIVAALPLFAEEPPADFPRIIAPGHEAVAESFRNLYWLHYPGTAPQATLWDEWLSVPALWPAVTTNDSWSAMRAKWRAALSGRIIDPDGYVATHQHTSIAHQTGWPFPFWAQGTGGWGWHFNLDGIHRNWTGTDVKTQEGWVITGGTDDGIHDQAWNVKLDAPHASVTAPAMRIDPYNAPFIQLRWRASGLGNAQPYLEWTREDAPEYAPARRMYFAAVDGPNFTYTMVPVYTHPEWKGAITGLRVQFGNERAGATVGVQALFTQYDTRHNINNSNFVRGCANYFNWTGDIAFLRDQIGRMRIAMRYIMTEFHADKEDLVMTTWVGHEGRSGIKLVDGKKEILSGNGIGNNYWDLLPMGYKDCYATYQYYDALNVMAEIEAAIVAHPEWNIPGGALAFTAESLRDRAARVKKKGNDVFWNPETKRFFCAIDIDGVGHDWGLTFLNLEAIHFGFASDDHAKAIMDWITGDRIVEGDTSIGADIYHWRFGPRATTKRNVEYYLWAWSGPESIPWGGQVQDGGAVMGFTYYDLMARLKVRGADSVSPRVNEIAAWFDEVTAAGGYRKYYDGTRPGTLQGGGTAGGLGLDQEFFESVMAPQIFFDGFLGFDAKPDGFALNPRLPGNWPELGITRIRFRDLVLDVKATQSTIEITVAESHGPSSPDYTISLPKEWNPAILTLPPNATTGTTLKSTK